MGSTSSEDQNKPVSLYDSSLSQPLVSKPSDPSPIQDDSSHLRNDTHEPDSNQYLHITFNYGPRSLKDIPFLVLFLLFVVCTFGFGIFAICNRNSNYSSIWSYSYNYESSSCVKDSALSSDWVSFNTLSSSHFLKDLIWTLVVTLILSVPICLGLLLLLRHYTKQLVYVSLPFFIIIPIFLNVYWFVACTLSFSCSDAFPMAYRILVLVFIFLIIGVIVWILVVNWHRIELTIAIIGVAANALFRNLGLFGVLPGMSIGLVVYYAPIVAFMVFSRFNGKIVPKKSYGEYTCVWKQDSWVPAYFALAILTMLWSAAAMVEAQVYVISGTIAQWYFSKEDAAPRKSIRSSLRWTQFITFSFTL